MPLQTISMSVFQKERNISNNNTFVTTKEYTFPILNTEDIIEVISNKSLLIIRNQY